MVQFVCDSVSGCAGFLCGFIVSQVVGVSFAVLGWRFLRGRTERAARRLFLASLVYLQLVLLVLVSDAGDPPTRRDSSPETRVVEISVPAQDETRHMVEF